MWPTGLALGDVRIVVGRMNLSLLQELDEVLTGAGLQLQVGDNGRLRNVDLEGVRRPNRRLSERTENLRLVLARMVAGLDLHLPRPRKTEGDFWVQYRDVVLFSPSSVSLLFSVSSFSFRLLLPF